jgi:hypothetical protein
MPKHSCTLSDLEHIHQSTKDCPHEGFIDDVNPKDVTKRIILSTTAKYCDPLGLIFPIVLMLKLLLQQLCKSDLSWDEILNEGMTWRWQLMINS